MTSEEEVRNRRIALCRRIWTVEVAYKDGGKVHVKTGGCVCVDPRGLILTVEQILPQVCTFETIRGRNVDGVDLGMVVFLWLLIRAAVWVYFGRG
ncbi:unnamed protein product [Cuscuta campestris]|uniref:Uncharacterized protein n=1 Tax=Cuscuta campestris TaxID=132261 RepID=A0A484NNE5_9ASTE|nr:unnamed protein product [Cuscuta campestris]